MRLVELKRAIERSLQTYKFEVSNSNGYYYIGNILALKSSLLELNKVNLFDEKEKRLLSPIFNSMGDKISFNNNNSYSELLKLLNEIGFTIYLLNNWFQKFMPENIDEDSSSIVNIKLPNIHNFDDLNKVANELRLAFSAIVNEYEGGKIEIIQFDHGSYWLILKVGTALTLISALAWSGAVVAKKTIECKNAYEIYQNASIRNDLLEELEQANEKLINIVIEQEAKLIQQEHFKKEDNEQLERIKNSIYNISELIIRGTEIHPALAAPEEVQNLFPDFKSLPLIESRTKKLTEKTDSDELKINCN